MPPPMTTGEIAECINAILGAKVYTDKTIRAEIDMGHIRAARNVRRAKRRSITVTEDEFLRWAADVLRADDLCRLRESLAKAS